MAYMKAKFQLLGLEQHEQPLGRPVLVDHFVNVLSQDDEIFLLQRQVTRNNQN